MTTIFVPTRFKDRVLELAEIIHVADEESIGECNTIPIWGYLMEVAHGVDVRELFGIRNCYDSFVDENKTAALFVAPLTADEREVFSHQVDLKLGGTKDFPRDSAVASFKKMMEFLKPIALSQNCAVTLHITEQTAFEPFYDDDHIHVVMSSRPPGNSSDQRPIAIEDVMLSTKLGGAKCPGPTEGRGHTVPYDEDFVIGQIVGSTIYLFLPTGKEAATSLAHQYDNPFRIALALVWDEYLKLQREKVEPEVRITSYPEFVRYAANETMAAMAQVAHEEEIVRLQKTADHLRRELAYVHSQLQLNLTIVRALGSETALVDQLPFWHQLVIHPSFERTTVTEGDMVHYHTTPVYIEDEDGALRDVGSFTLCVGDFDVHIWSNRITHPERLSHPHIASEENSVCFGNIGSELAKLCAENRKIEAVLLCLSWLTEGYEPSLTYHRVEEWPLAITEAVTKEVVHA